jgi:hypothetical protein
MFAPNDGTDPLDPKRKLMQALTGGNPIGPSGSDSGLPPISTIASTNPQDQVDFLKNAEASGAIAAQKARDNAGNTLMRTASPGWDYSGITPNQSLGASAPKIGGVEVPPIGPSSGPSVAPGAHAGQKVTLLGFDSSKLEDPGSGGAAGSKYSPAAKTFYNGLKQDVGLQRGGLGNMVLYAQGNGFPNAKAVGDDKIDFGDGNGPVDVIRGDGQIVFQNTTSNPVWEGKNGGGGASGGGGSAPMPDASAGGSGPALSTPLDPLLGGDPLAKIMAALSQLSGPRSNAQALMQQLVGGQSNG